MTQMLHGSSHNFVDVELHPCRFPGWMMVEGKRCMAWFKKDWTHFGLVCVDLVDHLRRFTVHTRDRGMDLRVLLRSRAILWAKQNGVQDSDLAEVLEGSVTLAASSKLGWFYWLRWATGVEWLFDLD